MLNRLTAGLIGAVYRPIQNIASIAFVWTVLAITLPIKALQEARRLSSNPISFLFRFVGITFFTSLATVVSGLVALGAIACSLALSPIFGFFKGLAQGYKNGAFDKTWIREGLRVLYKDYMDDLIPGRRDRRHAARYRHREAELLANVVRDEPRHHRIDINNNARNNNNNNVPPAPPRQPVQLRPPVEPVPAPLPNQRLNIAEPDELNDLEEAIRRSQQENLPPQNVNAEQEDADLHEAIRRSQIEAAAEQARRSAIQAPVEAKQVQQPMSAKDFLKRVGRVFMPPTDTVSYVNLLAERINQLEAKQPKLNFLSKDELARLETADDKAIAEELKVYKQLLEDRSCPLTTDSLDMIAEPVTVTAIIEGKPIHIVHEAKELNDYLVSAALKNEMPELLTLRPHTFAGVKFKALDEKEPNVHISSDNIESKDKVKFVIFKGIHPNERSLLAKLIDKLRGFLNPSLAASSSSANMLQKLGGPGVVNDNNINNVNNNMSGNAESLNKSQGVDYNQDPIFDNEKTHEQLFGPRLKH